MITQVIKRDGRKVQFNKNLITNAIFKAALAVGGSDRDQAEELSSAVLLYLNQNLKDPVSAEEIQDVVENTLIKACHFKTAKAYILYSAERSRRRESQTSLMDAVAEILVETSRENANISNSPSAKMLQIASAASKTFYLSRLIPEHLAKAHICGDCHIHDLDFYGKTLTCPQNLLEFLYRRSR